MGFFNSPSLTPPHTNIGHTSQPFPPFTSPNRGAIPPCGRPGWECVCDNHPLPTHTPPPPLSQRTAGSTPHTHTPPHPLRPFLPAGTRNPPPKPKPPAASVAHRRVPPQQRGREGVGRRPPVSRPPVHHPPPPSLRRRRDQARPISQPQPRTQPAGHPVPEERQPGGPLSRGAAGPPAETAPGPTSSSASCAAALLPQSCLSPLRARPPLAHWFPPLPAPRRWAGRGVIGSFARHLRNDRR